MTKMRDFLKTTENNINQPHQNSRFTIQSLEENSKAIKLRAHNTC